MKDLDESRVIAIDGPGGSGKSTVARALAQRLGYAHLDTGAMYRAVTWAVLRGGTDPDDPATAAAIARQVRLDLGDRVVVDDVDVSEEIRGPAVTKLVSTVSAHPAVREEMVRRQREWVAHHDGAVVEGRDIGTVVFPSARLKVYLTASDEVRARRRAMDAAASGAVANGRQGPTPTELAETAADLARRDGIDSTRAASPLSVADDAVVVDTSDSSVEEIVDALLTKMEAAR